MRPTLRRGRRGDAVREMTKLLVERGHLDRMFTTFTDTVKKTVEEFQARHVDERGTPLVVDGIVGPLTWWALLHPDNTGILILGQDVNVPATGGSPRGRAALGAAVDELRAGACETGANNCGAWVEKYLNGLVATPANWCAAFVSWCFDQHIKGAPFNYSLGARDIRNQFRDNGWAFDLRDDIAPEPGDIVVWWRGQRSSWNGHIGFVLELSDGGILYTIEGNKGGFPAPVGCFNYVASRMEQVLGFGRVPPAA